MNSRNKLIIISIGLFCAALFLRLWIFDFNEPFHYDENLYHEQAVHLVQKGEFINEYGKLTAWRTPGFPFIVASVYKLGGDIFAARLLFIVLSAFTVVGVFLLSYFLFNEIRIALAAGVIQTVLPTDILFSGRYYGEETALFLVVFAFLLAVVSRDENRKSSLFMIITAGLLFGAAILTRGYLIFAILAMPAFLLTVRKSKKLALICLLASMALPFGWMIRNAFVINSFTFSTETFQAIWHGNNAWSRGTWNGEWSNEDSEQRAYLVGKYPTLFSEMSEVERSKIFQKEAISEITGNPKRIVWLLPRKIALLLYPSVFMKLDWLFLLCLPLSFVGFLAVLKKPELRGSLWFLVFPIVTISVICLITFGDPRFRHPVDFGFVILAAYGLFWLFRRFAPSRKIA